jgi:hypothetical protein
MHAEQEKKKAEEHKQAADEMGECSVKCHCKPSTDFERYRETAPRKGQTGRNGTSIRCC